MAASRQHVVRVTDRTHRALRELAEQTGASTPAIIEQAIDRYQQEQIIELASAQWAALLADPAARAELEDAFWGIDLLETACRRKSGSSSAW